MEKVITLSFIALMGLFAVSLAIGTIMDPTLSVFDRVSLGLLGTSTTAFIGLVFIDILKN